MFFSELENLVVEQRNGNGECKNCNVEEESVRMTNSHIYTGSSNTFMEKILQVKLERLFSSHAQKEDVGFGAIKH